MPGADLTVRRSELGALTKLGTGGTAVVYRAPGFTMPGVPDVAYKEYKPSTRRQAGPALFNGLLPLVRFREKLDAKLRGEWDQRIIWPLRVVVDDDHTALGILMPLIRPAYFQRLQLRSGQVKDSPREIDLLFGESRDLSRIGIPPVDVRTRLALVSRIAGVYAMMHRAGVILGDISARNVVYQPDPGAPSVLVVDADSARLAGNRSAFSSQPHTPHWEPPEAMAAARRLDARAPGLTPTEIARLHNVTRIQNKATDVYKFGLIVVRVLDPGRGKAVNRDPERAMRAFRRMGNRMAVDLLERSIGGRPADRPSMRDWYLVLNGRHPEETPVSPVVPAPEPGLRPGQREGNWVFEEGRGWVRTPLPRKTS